MEEKKTAVIIGAGPAGLTAAFELLEKTGIRPVVLEADELVGGLARTVLYRGNRMDLGGHRFFSKSREVMDWWCRMMPIQGKRSKDDLLLDLDDKMLPTNGPDPEKEDCVMLKRHRVSRIFFARKFFDYPISLSKATFANMGFARTAKAVLGYLVTLLYKRPERSLEDFYRNRFGGPLYKMFFEDYTEKVWGIHPSKLGADWGSQRVKSLSVWAVIKDVAGRKLGRKGSRQQETSLIREFIYPKYGPGQLWEMVADEVKTRGGEICLRSEVVGLRTQAGRVVGVEYKDAAGCIHTQECDYVLSSMPIKDLVSAIRDDGKPEEISRIASELPYRDFITVGLCVRKLKISNETAIKTWKNRVPDTWIYIQERDVKIGRLQIFNNWSPYLVNDYENTVWLGLEYFCSEGDALWEMGKDAFVGMAVDELAQIGIIEREDVLDACHVRVKKAYPAYCGSYYKLGKVKAYLNEWENLFCLGRNGQHRYNNLDHSMLTAMKAVEAIATGSKDKSAVWAVNAEEEYLERRRP